MESEESGVGEPRVVVGAAAKIRSKKFVRTVVIVQVDRAHLPMEIDMVAMVFVVFTTAVDF